MWVSVYVCVKETHAERERESETEGESDLCRCKNLGFSLRRAAAEQNMDMMAK
jgi:hypothetical protein